MSIWKILKGALFLFMCSAGYGSAEYSIVQIMAVDSTGRSVISTGTGFSHKTNYIMTARHVVRNGHIKIIDHNKVFHDGRVVSSGDPDWAIVHVPTLSVPTLDIDTSNPKSGRIVVYGDFRGTGGRAEMSFGSIKPSIFQGSNIHATAKTRVGFSGGPVIHESGKVVGIVSKDTPVMTCLYVPLSSVKID